MLVCIVARRAQPLQRAMRIIKRNEPQRREEVHERAWGAAYNRAVWIWAAWWVGPVALALAMEVVGKNCSSQAIVRAVLIGCRDGV